MKSHFAPTLLLLLVALSLGVESYQKLQFLDYRLAHRNRAVDQCTQSGLKCKGCREVVFCSANASGWEELHVETCKTDEICVDSACVKTESTECSPTADMQFRCTNSGMFPNPGDCKRYHFCVPQDNKPEVLRDIPMVCDNDNTTTYGYNPGTTFCSTALKNGKCNGYPIPLCTQPSQKGPVTGNPTLYYICLPHGDVLYPYQMTCPNGKIYNSIHGCQ